MGCLDFLCRCKSKVKPDTASKPKAEIPKINLTNVKQESETTNSSASQTARSSSTTHPMPSPQSSAAPMPVVYALSLSMASAVMEQQNDKTTNKTKKKRKKSASRRNAIQPNNVAPPEITLYPTPPPLPMVTEPLVERRHSVSKALFNISEESFKSETNIPHDNKTAGTITPPSVANKLAVRNS